MNYLNIKKMFIQIIRIRSCYKIRYYIKQKYRKENLTKGIYIHKISIKQSVSIMVISGVRQRSWKYSKRRKVRQLICSISKKCVFAKYICFVTSQRIFRFIC